ncbi:hypothetical protein NQ314_021170 [Rhamnusium bicolor]|uniref:Cyclin-dependent kinase inhibitor domain-containing protein n=1 Tax=Rhamnusium bicolor TaxID=1586634 RepID=A0AAV8WIV5_9CUCU|nr:hypothetical protein NQ314_021170 [Rhamnusium bicolor]
MSTSIYKPLGFSFSSRTPDRMLLCRPEVRKVKRVLFEPVDHVATQKFIDEELSKITILESEKWNFDFIKEETLNANGIYNWRPATPQKTIRPIKTRPGLQEDNQEFYGEPVEIIRPTPVRAVEEEEMKSPPKSIKVQNENEKPQRLITGKLSI